VHRQAGRPTTQDVSESPFRFGLERVREVRVHDERTAQEGLAGSLMARSREQAALAAVQSTLEHARRTATSATGEQAMSSGPALVAGAAWVQRLERRRDLAAVQSARADEQVVRDRVSVLEAARRREALDRLRDRRLSEHTLAAGRAESARLDEIALRGHRGAA
jgi:flagellar FliJ protein